MSDDLSAFFAKKKDKKKKTAVKIEEVGQVLERRAKRQEEYEQEHEEVEKRAEEDKTANPAEESEWIEYGDSNQGRLEGLKIKDMGLENEDDQVNNEEPEDREVHETKTWGQVNSEKKAHEESETAVTISDKAMAAAYMPPSMRKNFGGAYKPRSAAANFDMNSDAAFPSLADASKIEKVKKEESKSPGGWVKAGAGASNAGPPGRSYATTSGSGREAALAAVKNMMSSASPATTRSENTPSPTPAPIAVAPAPVAAPAAPKPGSYVPPHLRNRN